MNISVSFRGETRSVKISNNSCIKDVFDKLEDIFNVPKYNQKVLCKGKLLKMEDKDMIDDGTTVMLIGSTKNELANIKNPTKEKCKSFLLNLEEWETEERHKKVIDMGIPDGRNAPFGCNGTWELPSNGKNPLTHLRYNEEQAHITMENDKFHIKTKSQSETVFYNDIAEILHQKITSIPGCSIVCIKKKILFATYLMNNVNINDGFSEIFLYFFPNQYIDDFRKKIYMYNLSNL